MCFLIRWYILHLPFFFIITSPNALTDDGKEEEYWINLGSVFLGGLAKPNPLPGLLKSSFLYEPSLNNIVPFSNILFSKS